MTRHSNNNRQVSNPAPPPVSVTLGTIVVSDSLGRAVHNAQEGKRSFYIYKSFVESALATKDPIQISAIKEAMTAYFESVAKTERALYDMAIRCVDTKTPMLADPKPKQNNMIKFK